MLTLSPNNIKLYINQIEFDKNNDNDGLLASAIDELKELTSLSDFNKLYNTERTIKGAIDGYILFFNEMLNAGEFKINKGEGRMWRKSQNDKVNINELNNSEISERSDITEDNDDKKNILDLNPSLTDGSIINIPKKKAKPIIDDVLKTLNNSIFNEKKEHLSSPTIRTSDVNKIISTKKTYVFNDLNEDEQKLAMSINLPDDKIYIFKALRTEFGELITEKKLRAYGVNQFSRDLIMANPTKHRDTTIKAVIKSVLVYDGAAKH